MSSASIHDKLTRVRRPRVHITYQVETEGARVQKELPFVVGVMGDFSGNQPTQPLKPLKDRKFVQIDRDNFNDVMARMTPRASTSGSRTRSRTTAARWRSASSSTRWTTSSRRRSSSRSSR